MRPRNRGVKNRDPLEVSIRPRLLQRNGLLDLITLDDRDLCLWHACTVGLIDIRKNCVLRAAEADIREDTGKPALSRAVAAVNNREAWRKRQRCRIRESVDGPQIIDAAEANGGECS